jgi:hypothetical protein
MIAILIILQALVVVFALVFITMLSRVFVRYWKTKDEKILEERAGRDGVRLLSSEPRVAHLHKSPWKFFSPGQRVYRITGEDSRGAVLDGWARCGGAFRGNAIETVEIRWDMPRFPETAMQRVDPRELESPELEPGESIIWSGRPDPDARSRQSFRLAAYGLAFIAFVIVWIAMVVLGFNNNWDRGRAVKPFATHNVIIAACAGLWFLPMATYMLTARLRARWRADRTRYFLTNRSAIIIEPRALRSYAVHRFSVGSLTPRLCNAQPDGLADLVFFDRKTWSGRPQDVGFLSVDDAQEVANSIRSLASIQT